jgi:hypothetical protein
VDSYLNIGRVGVGLNRNNHECITILKKEKISMKKYTKIVLVVSLVIIGIIATTGIAYAAPPEKANGFICPVLGGKAGMNGNSSKIEPIAGGYYTVAGPDVMVPAHATNEGFPTVEGSFLTPGEVGYTAIWNHANAPD